MSLNELFHRHQMSLMRAAVASSAQSRRDHRAAAAMLADRIETVVRPAGATTAPLARS